MEPIEFYQRELSDLQNKLKKLKQKKSSFAWLRLGAIFAIIAAFYFLWSLGAIYVISACVLLVFIFIKLVYADLDNQAIITHTNKLIGINEDEIKSLNEDYSPFKDGTEHITREHPYSNDLDIFGRASLFQFFNRTTSEMGSSQLANYMKSATSVEEIKVRQEAVRELAKKVDWIQNLQAEGRKQTLTFSTEKRLI